MNLYEEHFSYISKFKSYAKKYQGMKCRRFISKSVHLVCHKITCKAAEIKETFVGGKYISTKTVFKLLKWLESMYHNKIGTILISNADVENCENAWQEGLTFADFVKFYNNADVIGFTEVLEKYLEFNKTKKLDVFKMSMSLPGLTKQCVF